MEAAVFRVCLSILQNEMEIAKLVGDQKERLVSASSAITSDNIDKLAVEYGVANITDQAKVFPYVVSTLHRILNRCMDLGAVQTMTVFTKIGLCCKCLVCLRDVLQQVEKSSLAVIQTNITKDLVENTNKLLVLMIISLDSIKINENKLSADDELIALACLQSLQIMAKLFFYKGNEAVPAAFNGHFLAQIIQSCLFYSKQKSKTLAIAAIRCLQELVALHHDKTVWKMYYPGMFGGLYSVCIADYKTGSHVKVEALQILLQTTIIVADDSLYSAILPTVTRGVIADSSETAADNALRNVLLVVSGVRGGGDQCNSDDLDEKKKKLSVWRVDLLQRIREPLYKAYHDVYRGSSPVQRKAIVQLLHRLLTSCRLFLGTVTWQKYLALLLQSLDDDSFLVQSAAQVVWKALCDNNNCITPDIEAHFAQEFIDEIVKSSKASLDNEGKVMSSLSYVLGIATGFTSSLAPSVRAAGSGLWRSLGRLLYPDISVHGSQVSKMAHLIESRQYYGLSDGGLGEEESVTCGYYRYPWECIREEKLKAMLRRLCVLIGRFGCTEVLHNYIVTCTSKVSKCMYLEPMAASASVKTELVDRLRLLFSLWGIIGCSVLSPVSRVIKKKKPLEVCVCCHKETIPKRCTRCSQAIYCSVECQKKDWSSHKLVCKKPVEAAVVPDDDTPDSESFVSDPDTLLAGPMTVTSEQNETVKRLIPCVISITKTAISFAKSYVEWSGRSSSLVERYALSTAVAAAVEAIGNCFLLLRSDGRRVMFDTLFNLLDVLAATAQSREKDVIVQTAIRSTLSRMALYMQFPSMAALLHSNLDYIVDEACARLKVNSAYSTDSDGSTLRALYIVDMVFHEIGYDAFMSNHAGSGATVSRAVTLLRDLVSDTIKNIDATTLNDVSLNHTQVITTLRVMQVLVTRAVTPIPLASLDAEVAKLDYIYKNSYKGTPLPRAPPVVMSELEADAIAAIKKSVKQFMHIANVLSDQTDDFHSGSTPTPPADEGVDESDEKVEVTPGVQLIQDLLPRLAYFISLPQLANKVLVIEILIAAFLRLASNETVLLPAIHTLWPSIMTQLKEQMNLFAVAFKPQLVAKYGSMSGTGSYEYIEFTEVKTHEKFNLLLSKPASQSTDEDRGVVRYNSNYLTSSTVMLLPCLLQLFTVLTAISADFLTMKFADEFWPVICEILKVHLGREAGLAPDTKKSTRFSLDVKLKISLLVFFQQIANLPNGYILLRPYVPSLVWLHLPFLMGSQIPEVVQLGKRIYHSLFKFDPTYVTTFLGCVVENSTGLWEGITCDPRIISVCYASTASSKSVTCVPEATKLLGCYRKDPLFLENLRVLLRELVASKSKLAVVSSDSFWKEELLKRFAAI